VIVYAKKQNKKNTFFPTDIQMSSFVWMGDVSFKGLIDIRADNKMLSI